MTIIFKGWKPGLQKIMFSHILKEHFNLSLRAAKTTVDDVLEGKIVHLEVSTLKQETLEQLSNIGVICEVLENPQ
jgi:hypothetical protein